MNAAEGVTSDGDTHDLCRVVQALTEVRSGHKRSHWIGFIYPQHDVLGVGAVCGISSLPPEKIGLLQMSTKVDPVFANVIELHASAPD